MHERSEVEPFACLRVLLGLAAGGAMTLSCTIAGLVLPQGVRATGYGLLSSAAMLGGALGPILCGPLSSIDPRAPLALGALVSLALTLHIAVPSRRSLPAPAIAGAAFPGRRP